MTWVKVYDIKTLKATFQCYNLYETSQERQPHTQENNYNGEFHLATKKQIIDR